MHCFKTLEDRKLFIEELKVFIQDKFTKPYNVFVFGSFLTTEFVPGKSDLDLALYTKGSFIELESIVQEFLSTVSIDSDVIWIKPEFNCNYIDIAPLVGYRLTDYYPDELGDHLLRLIFTLQRDLENRSRYKHLYEAALEVR